MLLDSMGCFCNNKAITASANFSDVIDAKSAVVSEGNLYAVVRILTDTHGITEVELQGSNDNSTFAVFGKMDITDTTKGAGCAIPVPQGAPRYMRLKFGGSSANAQVEAYLTTKAPSPRGKRIGDYAARESV